MTEWQNLTEQRKLTLGNQPIVHRKKWARLLLSIMKEDRSLEGSFKKPDNLTIVSINTREEKSLFERCLNYLGVSDFIIIRRGFEGDWKSAYKISFLLDYLKSGACKTEYLLYCDAFDSILWQDPQRIVQVFEGKGCDLLFASTMFKRDMICMAQVFEWLKTVAPKRRFLNAGAFIGKTKFVQEVFEEASKYVVPDSITLKRYEELGPGTVGGLEYCKELSEFPKGATDQSILRYLHPQFYPRMDMDYRNELVYRN